MKNLNFEYEFYYTMEIIKDSINLIQYLMNQLIDALSHAYTYIWKYKTFKQVLLYIIIYQYNLNNHIQIIIQYLGLNMINLNYV